MDGILLEGFVGFERFVLCVLKQACKENGVTLVAYSPLCQGLLTGKYVEQGSRPFGPRKLIFTDSRIRDIQPLLSLMKAIGEERGKTLAQVRRVCGDRRTAPLSQSDRE